MALISVDSTPHYAKTSFGADVNPMKFYSTTYSTYQGHEHFVPRTGVHSGAGYVTNIRPVLHYTSSVDRLDNPALGQLLQDNYLSIIKKHFVPYGYPDGREDFPHKLHSIGSGFMRTKPLNFPFLKDMKAVQTDTKDHGPSFVTGIQPKRVPLLHQIQSKDPVMQENRGHGPLYMSTEYNAKYKLLHSAAFSQHKTVGKKENTGFTEGSDLNPITFHHPSTYQGDQLGYCTDRPTGISLTKSDYLPSRTLQQHNVIHANPASLETLHELQDEQQGDEFLPAIANRSNRGTSFTNEVRLSLHTVQPSELHNLPADKIAKIKKEDPAEYLHRTHLNDPSSINALTYTKPEHKPLQAKLSGRLDVGNQDKIDLQESTGFTSNENGYVYPAKSATDTNRFLTNYKLWHNDKTPKGEDREGWTRGGIQKQLVDGFVRSSIIHKLGPDYNITENLHRIHPHVARTIRSVDEHHDDHTHDHKQRPPGLTF